MNHYLLMILGMAAVTMAARVVPVFLVRWGKPPRMVQEWLEAVPFAALGALIVPGIVTADPVHPLAGIAAAVAAGTIAWLRAPAYISAVAAVVAAFVVQQVG